MASPFRHTVVITYSYAQIRLLLDQNLTLKEVENKMRQDAWTRLRKRMENANDWTLEAVSRFDDCQNLGLKCTYHFVLKSQD